VGIEGKKGGFVARGGVILSSGVIWRARQKLGFNKRYMAFCFKKHETFNSCFKAFQTAISSKLNVSKRGIAADISCGHRTCLADIVLSMILVWAKNLRPIFD
jgi:hypothetical protein